MRQILFFAVKDDLTPVLKAVEQGGSLKYALMRDYDTSHYPSFRQGSDIPNLGYATSDSAQSCDSFLVAESSVSLNVRPIDLAAEVHRRFSMDQLLNPDTVTFTPGGLRNDDVVLHGRVATVSKSVRAQQLMKRFHSAFKEHYKKVKAFYVGPNAFDFLESGKRLTISVQSPREFDLAI